MLEKIKKAFFKPQLVILYILNFRVFKFIPDDLFLKIKYRLILGRKLDLINPISFNEKIQWLKLYDRRPEYTDLVDKYKVRRYIAETIGEEYLIPIVGIYNSFDEINFETLPNQFVLKPNHTSGNIFICKDKSKIDYARLRKEVDSWLKRKYYWVHREWPYKNITPKIICEKYMVNEYNDELKDYKFMCFNGRVRCSFVCSNRNSLSGLNVDFYDVNWKLMHFERHYPKSGKRTQKPKNYDKMIKFAEKLSNGISFLRVDFYEVNGLLYFGELTFYPGSGFEEFTPETYDNLLGNWIKIPDNPEILRE